VLNSSWLSINILLIVLSREVKKVDGFHRIQVFNFHCFNVDFIIVIVIIIVIAMLNAIVIIVINLQQP